MSQKQLNTYTVINRFIDGSISRKQAAEFLGLSTRQITRLKKGVLESGAESLIHKNTGRKPAHAFSEETKQAILEIHAREEFAGVNFQHFQEILRREYGIAISYTALANLLKGAGIESPKKKKERKHKHRRKRKDHPGELIQIDATPYPWFGGTMLYALHGAIDDATGSIVGLYMTQNECLYGYQEAMRQCCLNYGIPQTTYSDNHTIFRSPKTDRLTVEELIAGKTVSLTQFGRSMYELGIDMIFAGSPEAKGRVERLWETLQSRLPVEFAMRGIHTLTEANRFLETEYPQIFNQEFAVEPTGESIFVPVSEGMDIDSILCVKHTRKTDAAGTFSFKGRCFQILDEGFPIISARCEVMVLISPRFGIRVEYQGHVFETIRYVKPENKGASPKKVPAKVKKIVEPHLKYGSPEWKKIWWAEDYDQSLKFLYDIFFEKQHDVS